jgi:tRNA(Arg) A34 adenosine deaminase TadA
VSDEAAAHEGHMRRCLELARQARAEGNTPVGSVVVPFCVSRRLSCHQAVWHLFVLAGSALHYAEVLRCVARA